MPFLGLFLIPLIGLIPLGACAGGDAGAGGTAPVVTSDFRLQSLDGGKLGPPDFAGQVVVVDFWASWCIPCRKQASILEPLHADFEDQGVQFLAVDLGEDPETVRNYVEADPFPYPVLLDPEDSLTYAMGIYGLPTVMVVDREGRVAYFETGISTEESLRRVVRNSG